MPRTNRNKAKSKIYHIILRGNDKCDIFFDEQDYKKFIKELERTKALYDYYIYAYCLMPNHVHLLIMDEKNKILKIMQGIGICYSSYFNKKYERVGHLFQDRFLSKCVETDRYLMNVFRYIHQNPSKAGMSNFENYKWSSYINYFSDRGIVDTNKLKVFKTREEIKEFHKENSQDKTGEEFLEYEMMKKLTDIQVKVYIENTLNISNFSKLKEKSVNKRNEEIRKLKQIKGTSIAQISRVIGMNKRTIERIMKKEE